MCLVMSPEFMRIKHMGIKGRFNLHLEAGLIPLEADCMKFQPLLGWRLASTTHYNYYGGGQIFHM
jgi:hypothetical protein